MSEVNRMPNYDLDALEALHKAADLDPLVSCHIVNPGYTHLANLCESFDAGRKRGIPVAMMRKEWSDFFAALRNAAPEMFAEIRRLRAVCDHIQSIMRDYREHMLQAARGVNATRRILQRPNEYDHARGCPIGALEAAQQRAETAEAALRERDAQLTEARAEIERLKVQVREVHDVEQANRVAHDLLAQMRERAEKAEAALQREEKEHLETIDARDAAEDLVQDLHVRLGGDGEWSSSRNLGSEVAKMLEELKAQLAEARAEVERISQLVKSTDIAALVAERSHLQSQLAEARRDSERLDWWIAHPSASLGQNDRGEYYIFQYNGDGRAYCKTPRAAIDAAMKPESKEDA